MSIDDPTSWRTALGRAWVRAMAHLGATLRRGHRWSVGNVALVVTMLTGGAVVAAGTLVAGEVYEGVVTGDDGLSGLDQPVLEASLSMRSPGLDAAITQFTDVGGTSGMPILAVSLTIILALWLRSWTPVWLMSIAVAGSLTLTVLGKDLVGRLRPPFALAVPPVESSPSFPSGHTLNATVVTSIVLYLALTHLRSYAARAAVLVLGVAFAGAMGLSRVFLGHHWISDVAAGWAIGIAWAAVVVTAHRVLLTLRDDGTAAKAASGR